MFKITPDTVAIAQFAELLVEAGPDSRTLRCSYCALEVDTYIHAHDDAPAAIRDFIEHTAYDHSGRADILQVSTIRFARVMTRRDEQELAVDLELAKARHTS